MRRTLSTLLLVGALAVAAIAPATARPAQAGPPERTTIYDVASSSSDFDVLTAAVEALGLDGVLDGNRQFTVFAPTDAAFLAAAGVATEAEVIPALVGAFGIDVVREVVLFHVAPGERLSGDVVSSTQIHTLQGEKIAVSLDSGVQLANATLVTADVDVDNGVIHVIDAVMLPPSIAAAL